MRMMRQYAPSDAKTEAISVLSSMQSSLSQWLAAPPSLEHHPVSCQEWRAQLYEVARQVRSAGLHAHSSLSLRIGEQLEPEFRSNELPHWAVELLLCWSSASLRYLRDTAESGHAAQLVALLSMSHFPDHYGAKERTCLLQNLIDDRERDARRSARQTAEPGSPATGKS